MASNSRPPTSDDCIDLVAFNQFLRLRLGACRVSAGVSGDEFDLTARERVVLLFQVRDDALFHLDAALSERAGLDRQQAQLERRSLRDGGHREIESGRGSARRRSRHEFTTSDFARHLSPPIMIGLADRVIGRSGLILSKAMSVGLATPHGTPSCSIICKPFREVKPVGNVSSPPRWAGNSARQAR
jgi:hypothetical protein